MILDRVKNHKSQGGEIMEWVQECPFCHQNVMVEYIPGMTEQEINQLTIESCKCHAARTESQNKERIEQMEDSLDVILAGIEKMELKEEILGIGKLVCKLKVEKVTINISKTTKIVIKRDSKGNVIIEREYKNTAQEVI